MKKVILPNILLIEDNPADIRLTQEAIKLNKLEAVLTCILDGEEAINFIAKLSSKSDSQFPDLVFLDLNLPKKNGHEVLRFIRNNPLTSNCIVIVVTTSDAEDDIHNAYKEGANSVILKPVDFNIYNGFFKTIFDYWFNVVQLP